ncbi:hypothetical protein GGF50DRAFT_121884 [Schizophyllum commune]
MNSLSRRLLKQNWRASFPNLLLLDCKASSSVTAPSPPSSSSSATRKHLLSSLSTAPLALEFDLGVRPRTPLATTLTTLRDVDVDDNCDDDGDLVEHDLAVRGIDALIALDAERGLTATRLEVAGVIADERARRVSEDALFAMG